MINYTVADPSGLTSTNSLTMINVQGINDAPEVTSDPINFSGTEDGSAVSGDLSNAKYTSDPDAGSSLTFGVAAGGSQRTELSR